MTTVLSKNDRPTMLPDSERPDSELSDVTPSATDCVKVLEIVAISLGAIGLVGAAVIGLGYKLVTNMYDAHRVEQIAQNKVNYSFPEGSQGRIGLSIGAESFAVITDRQDPPSLSLFIQDSPLEPTDRTAEFVREMGFTSAWIGDWEAMTEKLEPFTYCNRQINLQVRQGDWVSAGSTLILPAIEYSLMTTVNQRDQTIRILATGANADRQAKQLLRTIQCKEEK